MRRIIREKEPARPSTRLSTLADAEQTDRGPTAPVPSRRKLVHLVRGDLDWIVMKCLEKDRTRRYETANGLAQDIDAAFTGRRGDGPAAEQVLQVQEVNSPQPAGLRRELGGGHCAGAGRRVQLMAGGPGPESGEPGSTATCGVGESARGGRGHLEVSHRSLPEPGSGA